MTSSQEFKKAIREGRINDAFVIAMGNAPELHITTWIASPNSDENKSKPRAGDCLRTHVNLVEGEIVNEIGEELIGDELYSKLQQFHLQQVTQGHQIISENLQSLQQMFRLLSILQKQQNGETYIPINPWKIAETSLPSATNNNSSLNGNLLTENYQEESIIEEEDSTFHDLLSISDLDLEPEEEIVEEADLEVQNEEDWGDLLNDEHGTLASAMLDLDNLDFDESEDWQEEWEDQTEFIANTSIENVNNQSEDQQ